MPAGRPPKITADLVQQIGAAVEGGLYKETSSALYDISRETLNEWLRRGAREKQRIRDTKGARVRRTEVLFVQLSDTVERAIAVANSRDLSIISGAAEGGALQVTTITRTRLRPVLTEDGKPVLSEGGLPIMAAETITERRETRAAPVWQAAAWKLERRDPRTFGRRVIRDPVGRDGEPLIALAVVRSVLAAADELPAEGWEGVEDHGVVHADTPKQLPAGDPLNPPADLPEG